MRLIATSALGICLCAAGFVLASFADFSEANRDRAIFLEGGPDRVADCSSAHFIQCWIAQYAPELYAYGGLFLLVVGSSLTLYSVISVVRIVLRRSRAGYRK